MHGEAAVTFLQISPQQLFSRSHNGHEPGLSAFSGQTNYSRTGKAYIFKFEVCQFLHPSPGIIEQRQHSEITAPGGGLWVRQRKNCLYLVQGEVGYHLFLRTFIGDREDLLAVRQ